MAKVTETKATPYVARYTPEELAKAAREAFNCDPVVARAAFRLDGKNSYSMEEAEKVVKKFVNKEVRG